MFQSFKNKLHQRWFQRLAADTHWTLNIHKVYVWPTSLGFTLLLLFVAMWLGALHYAVSLVYALAFWLVSMAGLSIYWAFKDLNHLKVQYVHAKSVCVDETMSIELNLQNEQAYSRHISARLYGGFAATHLLNVKAFETQMLQSTHVFTHRGVYKQPVFILESTYPFGWVRAFTYLKVNVSLSVWPKRLEYDLPIYYIDASEGILQESTQQNKSNDVAYLSVFQEGQDRRKISWKASAKNNRLVAYQFEDEPVLRIRYLDWKKLGSLEYEDKLSYLCDQILKLHSQQEGFYLALPEHKQYYLAKNAHLALNVLSAMPGNSKDSLL